MTFEYALENNFLREIVKDAMEVSYLRSLTDIGDIPCALEVGCGTGNGTRLIMKRFHPERLYAVDGREDWIAVARRKRNHPAIEFSVREPGSLGFDDETFDAAFDLADLHNTADWRRGVTEIHRVLKPGGLLILEELSIETFEYAAGKMFKALTEHPYDAMLTAEGFRDHVLETGFEILRFSEKKPFGLLKYFVMIARKR